MIHEKRIKEALRCHACGVKADAYRTVTDLLERMHQLHHEGVKTAPGWYYDNHLVS